MFRSGFMACTTWKVNVKQGIVGCGGSDDVETRREVCVECPLFRAGLLDVKI